MFVFLFLVCDFRDVFYKVPLLPCERPYYVLCYNQCYYIWTRLGQGSLNGPTLFGRLSAFLDRASQALLAALGARLQIYTDDPIMCITAPAKIVDDTVVMLIIFWRILGLDLATHKAQLAESVARVGYDVKSHSDGVTVSIKANVLAYLLADTKQFLSKNVIGIKQLRSHTSRANHVSELLFGWRPFLDALWAALTEQPAVVIGKRRFDKQGKHDPGAPKRLVV